ncbi:MAG: hypothetical protein J6C46_09980 [Clostridia bacterium]|nr:hypothetical protein [Clostridia bacterium]MBP3920958.1 hypothetical protein [Bacilli bacterium]
MMNYITQIIIRNKTQILHKITQFYYNAKLKKHKHSYGWEDVFRDIQLAYQNKQLVPTNKTIQKWVDVGYNVARNKRYWVFAYKIDNGIMYIYDVENCRNLTITYQNIEPFIIISNTTQSVNKQCYSIGYKVSACRLKDGYIYLYKNRQRLPNFRFNEIIKPFYRYKNGEIYAIGLYGNKKYKITLDGIAKALQEVRIHNITQQIIFEYINKRNLLVS